MIDLLEFSQQSHDQEPPKEGSSFAPMNTALGRAARDCSGDVGYPSDSWGRDGLGSDTYRGHHGYDRAGSLLFAASPGQGILALRNNASTRGKAIARAKVG